MTAENLAQTYLEFLQQQAWEELGMAVPVQDEERIERWADAFIAAHPGQTDMRDKLAERLRQEARELPSRYEDPAFYPLLCKFATDIERVLANDGAPLRLRPVLGTLPTGHVNAQTIAVPGSTDYLVVFDRGLFVFAHDLSKAVIRAFPTTPVGGGQYTMDLRIDAVRERIRTVSNVALPFFNAVLTYAKYGDLTRDISYWIEPEYDASAMLLRDATEFFALTHEYGHFLLGHLADTPTAPRQLAGGDRDVKDYNWDQEYQADVFGLMLSTHILPRIRGCGPEMAYAGAALYFRAMDVMDKAVSVLLTGNAHTLTAVSHPPAADRANLLRAGMEERRLADASGKPGSAVQLGAAVDQTVAALWEAVCPMVEIMHSLGTRPAPLWRATRTAQQEQASGSQAT